jgi:rhomboid protease GluP
MQYDEAMGSPQIPAAEILLPNEAAPRTTEERRPPRARWASSPATYFLLAINCLVFVAMMANHVSPISPEPEQLLRWGADNAGNVLLLGQWWRILTAMFVHVGIIHLATNMWCLWNLGLLAEPLMGSAGVLAVYLLTGAAGNLLSTLWNWVMNNAEWTKYHDPGVFSVGAGASGAVFGIAGALIVLLKSPRLPVPAFELRKLRRSVIYFAAINLVIPLTVNFGASALHSGLRIDNMAHIGGVSCGLLFAAPMVPRLGTPRQVFRTRLGVAIGLMIAVLVLFGFFVANVAA